MVIQYPDGIKAMARLCGSKSHTANLLSSPAATSQLKAFSEGFSWQPFSQSFGSIETCRDDKQVSENELHCVVLDRKSLRRCIVDEFEGLQMVESKSFHVRPRLCYHQVSWSVIKNKKKLSHVLVEQSGWDIIFMGPALTTLFVEGGGWVICLCWDESPHSKWSEWPVSTV